MRKARHVSSYSASRGTGLLAFFCISVVLAVLIIVSVLLKAFERDFIKETLRDLESTSKGIMAQLSSWQNVLKGADTILAGRPAVHRALVSRDTAGMESLLSSMISALDVDRAFLTDERGFVVCASHNDIPAGIDMSEKKSVCDALTQKKTSMSYGTLDCVSFAEIYASPLVDARGGVLGTLVLVYDLTAARFLSLLNSYGIENSLFCGTTRVASTVDGVVGTKLENPSVENEVLRKGRVFVGKVQVCDSYYYSVYTPLKNDDGSVAGMYFVAREITLIQEVTRNLFKLIIPVCVVIISLLVSLLVQRVIHDRKKLAQRVTQLGKQVDWDALTGANTRVFGMDELTHSFENFMRGFASPAIMILDVDNFKAVNDTYGHEAGDIVLKQLVQTIYGECRTSDKIIRWGGDEFVGLFEGMRQEVCKSLAENILKTIASTQFVFNGMTTKVTVSIGFSYFLPGDSGYEDALNRADAALYESKQNGKNTCSVCMIRH